MSESHIGYRLLLLSFILTINGFFAGAEVSLLSARRSKLHQLAASGIVGAQAAVSLLQNPERLLSVTQLGVTLASLGLGWAGEDTLFSTHLRPVRAHRDSCYRIHSPRRQLRTRIRRDELRACGDW